MCHAMVDVKATPAPCLVSKQAASEPWCWKGCESLLPLPAKTGLSTNKKQVKNSCDQYARRDASGMMKDAGPERISGPGICGSGPPMASGSLMPQYIGWHMPSDCLPFLVICVLQPFKGLDYNLHLHWPSQQALPSACMLFGCTCLELAHQPPTWPTGVSRG